MSEPNNSAWPFAEISESEGFDIDKIFGTGNGTAQADPFIWISPHKPKTIRQSGLGVS